MNQVIEVAKKVTAKYFAVHHHDNTDTVDYTLARVLALYGLLRLSEMNLGIDAYGEVDKRIAVMLTSGLAGELAYPHFRMGGSAGVYRFYQGGYRLGAPENSLLHQLAGQLRSVYTAPEPYLVTAESLLAVCPSLTLAAVALQRAELHDAAIDCFETVSGQLLDPATGLYRSALTAPSSTWCRANGFAAAALAEMLRYLPYAHPRRPALVARLRALLAALLALQTPAGLWRQALSAPESYEETSGSALIAYALFSAAAQDHLALPAWQSSIEHAWAGLQTRVNLAGNGNMTGMCAGEAPDSPQALNDLYGFGPMLLACAAYAWLRRGQIWSGLAFPQRSFEPPPVAAVEQYFARVHATCERNRNPDGSYYQGTSGDPAITFDEIIKESRTSHPIPRDTAHNVLGYLEMLRHDPQEIYRQRARAGLEWLVQEQEPDGCFRLWTRKKEGQVPHHGCLFETGIAAAALVQGYEFFRDQRYLAASARAARWELDWPVDRNVNYNAFIIWHLAEHYRVTRDADLLERTLYKTRQAMLTSQQPGGGWNGHNSWIWYHGINVRAYAALVGVLAEGHPFRPELERALRASLFYACQLQMENGAIHPNPDNLDKPSHLMFEIIVGLVTALNTLDHPSLRNCLNGLVTYRISPESGDPDKLFNNEKDYWLLGCSPWYVYALGAYLGQAAGTAQPKP